MNENLERAKIALDYAVPIVDEWIGENATRSAQRHFGTGDFVRLEEFVYEVEEHIETTGVVPSATDLAYWIIDEFVKLDDDPELEDLIAADRKFDGGEFSGSYDYGVEPLAESIATIAVRKISKRARAIAEANRERAADRRIAFS